jgi:O-antigen/teichoic acid export membrane protein
VSVARNARLLLMAEGVNAASGVALVVVLARTLNPAALGLFSFAFSFGAVASVACFYGSNLLLTRETARSPEQAGLLLGASLLGRGAGASLLFLLASVLLLALGYHGGRLAVALLLVLSRLCENIVVMACAFLRGFQDLEAEGKFRIKMNLLLLAGGAAALVLTRSLLCFAAVQGGGMAVAAAAAVLMLLKKHAVRPAPGFNWQAAMTLLRQGLPFTLYGIFLVLYVQTNTIMLSAMKGDVATGLYTAGFRFVSAAGLAAAGVTGALFPALARLSGEGDGDRLRGTFVQGVRFLLALGGGAGLVFFVFAPDLIHLLYGEKFGGAVLPLRVMAFSVLLSYANSTVSALLMAVNQEARSLKLLGSCVLFVFVVNAALLPLWGALGAGLTTLLPEVLYLSLQARALRKVRPDIPLAGLVLRAAAACGAVAFAAWPAGALPLPARAAIFVACVAAAFFGAGLVKPADFRLLVGRRGAGEPAHA